MTTMTDCSTSGECSCLSKGAPPGPRAAKDALSNDVVLSLILSYLDLSSLKDARLVCKKWNSIAATHLKKFNICVELDSPVKAREFLALMKRSPVIPFDHIGFSNDHVELYNSTYLELFSTMNIRALRVQDGTNFSVLREMLVFHVYNVEELSLSLNLFSHVEPTKFFLEEHKKIRNPILGRLKTLCVAFEDVSCEFLQDLFEAAPQLSTLGILQTRADVEGEQAIKALKQFKGKFFESLTLLHSSYKYLRDDLESLTEFFKTNQVRHVLLRFQTIGMNFHTLLQFFAAMSEYVEFFDFALNFDLSNFPTMKKLRNLETNQWSVLADLGKTFPALETLRLGSVDESVSHAILAPEQVPEFKNLTHLHILEYEGFKLITDEDLLARTFSGLPNIRKLCLHCFDKALPIICEYLRNLEELRLGSESLITDEGITGIPLHYCKDISHLNFPTTVVGDPKRLRHKGLAWFDKCKNFRLFHIDPPPRKYGKLTTRRNITNNSVFFGFAFMKSLRNLSIPYTQIDDDALGCISKHRRLRLVQLNVTGCPHLTNKGLDALRTRRRRLRVFNGVIDGEVYDSCDLRYDNSLECIKCIDPPPQHQAGAANIMSMSEDSDSDF